VHPRQDEQGPGAGIRISGATRVEGMEGDRDWTSMRFAFQVEESVRPVELVAELRATLGKVWIDAEATLEQRRDVGQPTEQSNIEPAPPAASAEGATGPDETPPSRQP